MTAANPSPVDGPDEASPTRVDYVALAPGRSVGRYEIVGVLGQGGFGITYRARDTQLDREVALKEYLPAALAVRQDGASVLPRSTEVGRGFRLGPQRFIEEGRTLATLHEAPSIVQVFDFLEENGTAYIVMELLRGETLDERIKAEGPLSPAELDAILWPLLEGLRQVHEIGFLHRDIKPANVLLGRREPADPDRLRRLARGHGRSHGGHDGDLHAGLCRARAVQRGQAGPVDRHLRPGGHALSRHHRQGAAQCLRPADGRYLRTAWHAAAGRFRRAVFSRDSMPAWRCMRRSGRRPSPPGARCSARRRR